MAEIEQRTETLVTNPDYAGVEFGDEDIAKGDHRRFIGGLWETHGQHQLDFLRRQGLRPDHRFIDIGAGVFRAGRYLIDYLEPAHYYGVDANLSLLKIGYDVELTDEQRARLPARNLRANDRFDTDFGVDFDMAIAQSVFTHLSLNHVRLCLFRLARNTQPGAKFYATFFEQARNTPLDAIVRRGQDGRAKFYERNVYWYYRSDLKWAATGLPWEFRYIGDWGHPRGQRMVEYTRIATSEDGPAARPAAAPSSRDASRGVVYRGRRWLARRIDPTSK